MSLGSPEVVKVVVISSETMSPFTTFFCETVVVVVVEDEVFLIAETFVGIFLVMVDVVVVVDSGDRLTVDNGFLTPEALSDGEAFGDAPDGDFN